MNNYFHLIPSDNIFVLYITPEPSLKLNTLNIFKLKYPYLFKLLSGNTSDDTGGAYEDYLAFPSKWLPPIGTNLHDYFISGDINKLAIIKEMFVGIEGQHPYYSKVKSGTILKILMAEFNLIYPNVIPILSGYILK